MNVKAQHGTRIRCIKVVGMVYFKGGVESIRMQHDCNASVHTLKSYNRYFGNYGISSLMIKDGTDDEVMVETTLLELLRLKGWGKR